jgi:amino acid adenylation domain-containing protein
MAFLLQHLLRDSARSRPEATALLFEAQTLTYGEVDRLSNALAHALRERGMRRGDRVALYMDKSPASILSIHGILKAGGAYVPLDPHAPAQRLAYILGNCGVRCLVASTAKAGTIGSMIAAGLLLDTIVFVDDGPAAPSWPGVVAVARQEWAGRRESGPPETGGVETDLAYILYTSGSTGTPKGVMISHRNSLGFVEWAADTFAVSPDDRLSSHAPLHFDLSILDIFVAMKSGASLALVPEGTSTFPVRLAQWIEKNAITVWYSVPSILTLLLLKGRLDRVDLRRVRLLIFAGEVFPTKYLRELMRALPGADFVNLYGPTETNVITWFRVPALPDDASEPIPVGWTCANTDLFVVDEDGRRVSEPGRKGELYARGVTVAQGYWGDPEKTGRSFVQNPFQEHFPDRVYRTGDIVTFDDAGCYRLVGRRDRMIKSRGYRIELDEIEVRLYAHPGVKEAAVVAVPDELIGSRIRAFVACAEGAALDQGGLREHCLEKLPRYMVPETIAFMDRLPKTSTGKIDRTLLAAQGSGMVYPET